MSEKIYTRLLRLYPARFRKEYEGEALQLIRDRLRNETGFSKRVRLWWDLLVDVVVGLPSAYRNSYAVPEAVSLSLKAAGIPSFKIMEEEALGLFSILIGGTISLIVLAVFAFLLSRPMAHEAIPGTHGRISPIESVLQRLNRAPDDSDSGSFQGGTTAVSAQMSEPKGQSLTRSVSSQNMPAFLSETGIPPMAVNSIPRFGVALKPSVPDRQVKMSFEVASIRQSKPGTFKPPSFALDNSDAYTPADPGGRFIADFPLQVYISFAYKLWLTPEQTDSMLAHLPKWVATDSYEIHAKAEGSPSKDQMRWMMQSLLADRFKLAVHFEPKQTPVFALVLDKPGRPGPKLRSHSDGPACDVHMPTPTPGSPGTVDAVFPPVCDAFMLNSAPNHDMLLGSRNATMQLIADSLPSLGRLGRPVVDQTGLRGRFDFTLQWTPDSEPRVDTPLESQGTTFLEALRDQLGMKLKPTKAPMNVLVVDHVERPSEN